MDEIVCVVPWHDFLLIFTRRGYIFRMRVNDLTGGITIDQLGKLGQMPRDES
jgi:hypothetical protein